MRMTQPKLSARRKKLYVSFSFDGKQIRKSLNLEDTKRNRNFAQNKLIPELQLKVCSGEFFNNSDIPTLDEFSKTSFEIHKSKRKEHTQRGYKRVYKLHIQPIFGTMRLDKIKASQIASWQNSLLEKLAPKTVKVIRTVLCTIFTDAYKDELISKNPVFLVDAPINKEVKFKKPFSIDEIQQILQYINPKIKAYFAVGFYTGMRTGEIIGLKWTDIDLENRTIKVQRAIRAGVESTPKTKCSIREIDIIEILLPYLQEHRKISRIDSTYVFESMYKKAFRTSEKISVHYWRPCLKALGIQYRTLYQMRHTFASMMISNGEDILWVSNMLGHKDSTTTLKAYARYTKQKSRVRGEFLLTQN